MKKYIDRRIPSTFKIQITSMVDMFVILLVFLLKSYSSSPTHITPDKNLTLPISSSSKQPVDALKMVVSQDAIFVEDKRVIELSKGQVDVKDVEPTDTNFIRALYNELDAQAQKSQAIAKVNETVEFEGKVIMQADRELPYEVLRKVMYTAMLAGYSDVKFAVMLNE